MSKNNELKNKVNDEESLINYLDFSITYAIYKDFDDIPTKLYYSIHSFNKFSLCYKNCYRHRLTKDFDINFTLKLLKKLKELIIKNYNENMYKYSLNKIDEMIEVIEMYLLNDNIKKIKIN